MNITFKNCSLNFASKEVTEKFFASDTVNSILKELYIKNTTEIPVSAVTGIALYIAYPYSGKYVTGIDITMSNASKTCWKSYTTQQEALDAIGDVQDSVYAACVLNSDFNFTQYQGLRTVFDSVLYGDGSRATTLYINPIIENYLSQ